MAIQLLNGHIEDTILEALLREGTMTTSRLHDEVFSVHHSTKQGFYRALRKLKSEEKVVVYKSEVSINETWARRIRHLLQGAQSVWPIGDVSTLRTGERITFKTKGLVAMDRLWSHLFSLIEEQVSARHPLFLFNPHNWSALLRTETDRAHERTLKHRKRRVYLVIGSVATVDKIATRDIGFDHVEFSFNPRFRQESYIAAIGEYVIEVRFSPETQRAVRQVFLTSRDTSEAQTKLQKLDKTAVCKIIIERDITKAREWSHRLSKDFYIPKQRHAT